MLKIAHRGFSGQEPENTLRALQAGIEAGADLLECDVRVCASGEVLIIHDDTVDRTTNGSGRISNLRYDEIKKLDAGRGERIPLFSEVMDLITADCGLLVEFKEKAALDPVITLLLNLEPNQRDNVILQAFDETILEGARQQAPGICRHILIGEKHPGDWLDKAQTCGAISINPYFKMVNPDFVSRCHARKLSVIPWTVDEPEDIERMRECGVDGIIGNYPERLGAENTYEG